MPCWFSGIQRRQSSRLGDTRRFFAPGATGCLPASACGQTQFGPFAHPVSSHCIIPELGRQRIDGGQTPRRASFVSGTRREWDASIKDVVKQPHPDGGKTASGPVPATWDTFSGSPQVPHLPVTWHGTGILHRNRPRSGSSSQGQRITASEMTVQLPEVPNANVPWKLSGDFKISFKTAEAKQRFLKRHTR